MKIRFLALIAVFMLLLSINVSAAGYEYSITPGSGFTYADDSDDLTDIAKKLGMTEKELDKHFDENNILYLAISDDTKTQIKLSAVTDEFSSAVSDISYLTDEQLKEFINTVSSDGKTPCETVINNDRKYIKVKNVLQDSGGVYTSTQYITICNNKTFYLFCYNEGNDTGDDVQKIFKTFSLVPEIDGSINIFIIIGIILFGSLAVAMIIGIIITLCRKKPTDTTEENLNEV